MTGDVEAVLRRLSLAHIGPSTSKKEAPDPAGMQPFLISEIRKGSKKKGQGKSTGKDMDTDDEEEDDENIWGSPTALTADSLMQLIHETRSEWTTKDTNALKETTSRDEAAPTIEDALSPANHAAACDHPEVIAYLHNLSDADKGIVFEYTKSSKPFNDPLVDLIHSPVPEVDKAAAQMIHALSRIVVRAPRLAVPIYVTRRVDYTTNPNGLNCIGPKPHASHLMGSLAVPEVLEDYAMWGEDELEVWNNPIPTPMSPDYVMKLFAVSKRIENSKKAGRPYCSSTFVSTTLHGLDKDDKARMKEKGTILIRIEPGMPFLPIECLGGKLSASPFGENEVLLPPLTVLARLGTVGWEHKTHASNGRDVPPTVAKQLMSIPFYSATYPFDSKMQFLPGK